MQYVQHQLQLLRQPTTLLPTPVPTTTITTTNYIIANTHYNCYDNHCSITNANTTITTTSYLIVNASYNYYGNPQPQLQLFRQTTAVLPTPTTIITTANYIIANAHYNY